MWSVSTISSAEFRKDNSVFLAFLIPIDEYESRLESLKLEHKKAVHFVRASRILNNYDQIVESSSDDGEPKGSSGVPVLNVLRGKDLIDCGIIVVRYFGGKLLGVGGLVRAYTNAALLAIDNAELLIFQSSEESSIELPFSEVERAKYLCKKLEIHIIKFDFMQNFVIIHIKSSKDKIESFRSAIACIR